MDLCREKGQPSTLWWFDMKYLPMSSEASHSYAFSLSPTKDATMMTFWGFPKRDCKSLCVCGWSVRVYIHWFKTFFKLSWTPFISAIFKRWQDRSLSNFLFSLCWGLNRLKCDGLCLLLSYCDCYFACERSFLAGKDSPGKFAHCRPPSHIYIFTRTVRKAL